MPSTCVMRGPGLLFTFFTFLLFVFATHSERNSKDQLKVLNTQLLDQLSNSLTCGEICSLNGSRSEDGRILHKKVTCANVWLRLLSACPAREWPPPARIPDSLRDDYTMTNSVAAHTYYFKQRYSGGDALINHWNGPVIARIIRSITTCHELSVHKLLTYGLGECEYVSEVLERHKQKVSGGIGLVWGSERPWIEALLLKFGASLVLTVEYGRIRSTHSQILTCTPQEYAAMMLSSKTLFDFAITFSSLEHAGLGRYGDALNPWGDFEASAQTFCSLKPGGTFFLGLPSVNAESSVDEIHWNAHRFYGPKRLPHMFANFLHLETPKPRLPDVHRASLVHVLEKPAS